MVQEKLEQNYGLRLRQPVQVPDAREAASEAARRSRRVAASSLYAPGGRTEAERVQERNDRLPHHIAITREIQSTRSTGEVLELLELRNVEFDSISFVTVLQRIAKLGGIQSS